MKLNWTTAVLAALLMGTAARAATITVSNTNDSGAGSLRAALAAATNGDTISATGIVGTITLTTGELLVSNSVTVVGPGPAALAVSGNGTSRVFHVNNAVTAALSGLTISNGIGSSFPSAGLWNDHATLTLSNCAVVRNPSSGIYNTGTVSVNACTISANSITNGGLGAGIFNDGGSGDATLSIVASTISSNRTSGPGAVAGAIFNNGNFGHATLSLSNCTFTGNSTVQSGGAIYHTGVSGSINSVLTVIACTFNGNTATNGGAIFNQGATTTIIGDTIFKTGTIGVNLLNSGGVYKTLGYNISSDNGGGFLTNSTDQINTDPLLGPLADNGGPTFTHVLLPGSPAIDRGNSFGSTTDQRGLPRTVNDPCIANASAGDGTDIGAFETQDICVNLQITAITREANDIRITWATYTGKTNTLERTAGLAGSFNNNFTGLTNIVTTGTTTNYLDVGAATNVPAFYYRVRLVP